MSTTLEFGSVREVWLATLDDPDTKYSFLIRDDAFTKSGLSYSRTTRLDQPIDLGPLSGWRQLSWEGGKDQSEWRDEQMFASGNADAYTKTGKLRLWPGYEILQKDASRVFDSYALGRGGDSGNFANTNLYMGERSFFYSGGAPSGGFKIYKFDPDAGTVTTLATTVNTLSTHGYTALLPATDDSSSNIFLYVGTPTALWVYDENGDAFTKDTNSPATGVNFDSLCAFQDGLYFCSGKSLYKRTPLAPYGVLGTHTKVKEHKAAVRTIGLEVWQNRLWYGVQYGGNRAAVGTSDGVTANHAFDLPEEFIITGLHAHYGALYIFGGKPQSVAGDESVPASIGQVWKYTGSSLTLLWESNDESNTAAIDGKGHMVFRGQSFGSCLVWGHAGFQGTPEERAGLMFYDAEKDAIIEGPPLPSHPRGRDKGMTVNGVLAWNNTIAISFRDFKNYDDNHSGVTWPTGVAYWRQPDYMRDNFQARDKDVFKGASVEYNPPQRYQHIISSTYHGDDSVVNENKTWLTGRIKVKVPTARTRIRVYALTKPGYWWPNAEGDNLITTSTITSDGDPGNFRTNAAGRPEALATATLVKQINYDSTNKDWRIVTFPMKDDDGNYLQSDSVQYAVVLENSSPSNTTNAETPEVDSMEVQWKVSPTRRRQWRIRAVLEDGQERLDGNANPLTTAQAMADRLESFWSAGKPFLMYEPNAGGGATGSPLEVNPTDDGFNVSQYRVESDDTQVAQEVSLTLVENVTS